MRWLTEGALEVRPPEARDNGMPIYCCRPASMAMKQRRSNCSIACCMAIARGVIKPRAPEFCFCSATPVPCAAARDYVEEDLNRLFNGRHESSSGPEALRACRA
jgi:succinylglutamate desuccinylase